MTIVETGTLDQRFVNREEDTDDEVSNFNRPTDPYWSITNSVYTSLKCLFYTIVLGIYVAYASIGYSYLMNAKSIIKECHTSHLWIYVIITVLVFLPLRATYVYYIKSKDEHKFTKFICIISGCLCIDFVIALWGGVEYFVIPYLYNHSHNSTTYINISNINIAACNDLIQSNFGVYAYISFLIQISICIIVGILLIYESCNQFYYC